MPETTAITMTPVVSTDRANSSALSGSSDASLAKTGTNGAARPPATMTSNSSSGTTKAAL
jgi:hypothetical protein